MEKVTLAKNVSDLFKLSFLDEIDYFKKDNNEKVKVSDGKIEKDVTNWYTDDAIDWDKLNDDVNKLKSVGIVISGISFPSDKLNFKFDYHLHLNISKQQCIDRRLKFLERYTDTESMEKTVMNQLIYPYYLDVTKRSKINKFVNINDIDDEKVFDNVFKVLIDFIQEYHTKRDQKILSEVANDTSTNKVSKYKKSEKSFESKPKPKSKQKEECGKYKITATILEKPENLPSEADLI